VADKASSIQFYFEKQGFFGLLSSLFEKVYRFYGSILRTLEPFHVFILLNGWICLHGVLD